MTIDQGKVETESLEPTGRQILAFEAPERYILYGGAMGGGKTTWLCAYAIELSMRYPGNRGFLSRHELASFRKTTQISLHDIMPWELVIKHNKTEQFYLFKNGSVIFYGGLGDDEKAIDRLKSLEIGWFGIDQAEETTEKYFYMLTSRLRLRTEKGLRYKGLMTANPAPNWIKVRFIDQALENHVFIPALPKDNPHLPPDYEAELRRTLPDELIKPWLEGDWEFISSINQVFPLGEVVKAMQRKVQGDPEDMEYGLDVAEYGGDETVLARRSGFKFEIIKTWSYKDPMEATGEVIKLINFDKKVPVKIDAIGPGNGVYFRMRELGFNAIPMKGSEKPSEGSQDRYKNKRTELHFAFRKMLPYSELPGDSKLRNQMAGVLYRVLSDGIIAIEPKTEMRRRGLPSPDRMEALLLANAPYEDTEPGIVYYEGSTEEEEKKSRAASPPEDDREWIDGEVARMTRGENKDKPDRPKLLKEQEPDDDEGEVFIG